MTEEDRLITTLEELGITKDNYRVLALLPLVLVAWADGRVQTAEFSKLLEIARRRSFLAPSAVKLFESWILERPSQEYVHKSLQALVELARRKRGVGADLGARDLRKLVELSVDVAEVAGGLWGDELAVHKEEEATIDSLAEVLHIDDGQSWKELLEDIE